MDFRFTEDQLNLREAIRDYLTGEHTPEVLRRLDVEGGRDAAIWDGLIGMGIGGLLVPEAEGGLGMGLIEAAIVAVELGRANVSEPIADTALVATPLLGSDQRAAIAAGALKVALAHPINPWIADLDSADMVLAGEAALPAPEDPAPVDTVDPLRRLFAPIECAADDRLLDRAALIAAAQLIGGAERMLELATDYAKTREQFGQPIGSFQAIKHHLATVAVKLEFARPVLWRAAYAAQQRAARTPIHISHAKVAATDAAMLAAETAIQVHGAMGYTYEVDLHFWMKRAWALAGAWGDRAWHQRRIEAAVIGGGMAIGPETTFASELNHG
ncbi:acyl-CoA dehydrogenase family protein [Flavisphingomonas formosensis]|uniref:acyl-CoA dehydrogenase family protein n=1 Tax=Flavisphingomonas formosensis TaxID=861534 RepID=UPI0012F8BC15|nr:acyl-CoA dehydrogenase family protein [Sphingomonas formosensis]